MERLSVLYSPRASPASLPPSAPRLEAEERDFLVQYGSRRRDSSGVLLTPPRGLPRDATVRTRAFVAGMLDRLAGKILAEKGITVDVNLYSADQMNAFAGCATHQDMPACGLRLLQTSNGEQRYEMGVNLGLLRHFENEEEVAFVLAHELNHILEGQVDVHSGSGGWVCSQAHEAVVDHNAVEMMAKAGYDPRGSLTAMMKLFAASPPSGPKSFWEYAAAGASTHHHPAVRMALLQAKVEMVRRQNPQLLTAVMHPIPSYIRLCRAGRTEYFEPRRAGFEGWMQGLTDALLAGAPLEDAPRATLPMMPAGIKAESFKPSDEQLERSFCQALDRIDAAQEQGGQAQGDAVLMLLYYGVRTPFGMPSLTKLMNGGGGPRLSWLSDDTLRRVTTTLGRARGWKADAFMQKIESLGIDFAAKLLMEPRLQKIFAPLYVHRPEFRTLVDKTPEMMGTTNKNWDGTKVAPYLAWPPLLTIPGLLDAHSPPGPLDSVHDHNFTVHLKKLMADKDKLERLSYGFPTITESIYIYQNPTPRNLAVRAILEPARQRHEAAKLEVPLQVLQFAGREDTVDEPDLAYARSKGVPPPQKRDSHPTTMYGTALTRIFDGIGITDDKAQPQSAESYQKLRNPMLGLLRQCKQRSAFMSGATFAMHSRNLGRFLVQLLEDPTLSAQQRQDVVDFYITHTGSWNSISTGGLAGEILRDFLRLGSDWSKQELRTRLETDHAAPWRETLRRELEKHMSTSVPSADDAAIEALVAQTPPDKYDSLSAPISSLSDVIYMMTNPALTPLALVGSDAATRARVAGSLDFGDTQRLIAGTDKVLRLRQNLAYLKGEKDIGKLSPDACTLLLEGIVHSQGQAPSLEAWCDACDKVIGWNDKVLTAHSSYRSELEKFVLPRLEQMPAKELESWLERPIVLRVLRSENAGKLLSRIICENVGQGQPVADEVKRVTEKFKLHEEQPVTYRVMRNDVCKQLQVQPQDLHAVFPPDKRSNTDKATLGATALRAWSGLVAATRDQTPAQQIQMIDYLMGRTDAVPAFVDELHEQTRNMNHGMPLNEMVWTLREELSRADVPLRVLVSNSFLAGPNSLLDSKAGKDAMLAHLLSGVSDGHRDLARHLAEVLLDSHGLSQSLAAAYIFGQRSAAGGAMSEAQILSSLFDAYGVPGIKFKQYLAFTSEFSQYREEFEEAQDNAMPISYHDMLELVNERMAENWPADLKVDGMCGSGSVNIAAQYWNPQRNEHEVLSVPREGIEEASAYDFHRLRTFLQRLTATPEDQARYGFMLGLLDVVEDSVKLEFERDKAFAMQQMVQPLYSQKVGNWEVRSVPAYRLENGCIFMAKAPGKGARQVAKTHPAAYREAMTALGSVELNVLLGMRPGQGARQRDLFANPDFHDGQVLIDEENRVVTLLDFGQAVPIATHERDYALDLLRVVTGHGSAKRLQRYGLIMQPHDVRQAMQGKDRMDRFIRLLGLARRSGQRVPVPVVNWILAVNRQVALAERTGARTEKSVRNLVLARSVGLGLTGYNRLHLMGQRLGASVVGPLGGVIRQAWNQVFHVR